MVAARVLGKAEVIVVADPFEAASLAADMIVGDLQAAVRDRGRADWATAGGWTPIGVYKVLREPDRVRQTPWAATHTWFGDERFVPSGHPESNANQFYDLMQTRFPWWTFDPGYRVRIPFDKVHPVLTGHAIGERRPVADCAVWMADELRLAGLPTVDGWPVFDLVFLGMGLDGHVLSVFPGSPAFGATDWAVAVPAPTHGKPRFERVTLNPAVLGVARRLVVVVQGAEKAEIVGRTFGSPFDPLQLPGQLAIRTGATWIIDAPAAAYLR